uniref:Uncharacterized protein n=1 Tax=Populus trichocarpa TaxID=3694 RepID=A0A3N7FTC6_POPTR
MPVRFLLLYQCSIRFSCLEGRLACSFEVSFP